MSEIWIWSIWSDVPNGGGAAVPADLVGYRVEASDGHIGEVDEASFDTDSSCLIVDTGFRIFGKQRMVPAGLVERIDEPNRTLHLSCTKEVVRAAPDFDPALVHDSGHRDAVGDAFAPSRYVGMTGDPIGPHKGPGRGSES